MGPLADSGRLCVSVIEARNVQADTSSGLDFYVKTRVGLQQAKTDVATNSAAPKFLKDLRLPVENPLKDTLTVELIQQGQRGDLVLGKESIQISAVIDKGTLVTWLPLISVDGDCAAEVCLVMRYVQANANRPMTPSYAIAAREARDRALGPTEPGMIDQHGHVKTGISKALFTDLQQPSTAHTTSSPLIKAHYHSPSTSTASQLHAVDSPMASQGHGKNIFQANFFGTPTQDSKTHMAKLQLDQQTYTATPAVTTYQLNERRRTHGGQVLEHVKHHTGRAVKGAVGAGRGLVRGLGRALRRARPHVAKAQHMPPPVAVAIGSVLGAIVYLAKIRPALEARDVEIPCAVGACFQQEAYDRFRARYSTF